LSPLGGRIGSLLLSAAAPTTELSHAPPDRIGWWSPDSLPPEFGDDALLRHVRQLNHAVRIVEIDGRRAVARGGTVLLDGDTPPAGDAQPLIAHAPALLPERLGDAAFRRSHGLRWAMVVGAMANGITSERMVIAMGRAGMIAFFGSAGLDLGRVEAAIDEIQDALGDLPHGFNLIHSPSEPKLESALADLYLRRGVRRASASAFLGITLPLVRFRTAGIHRDQQGRVVTPNHLLAKVSRVEVARKFLSPPPDEMLRELVRTGLLTNEQAGMAASNPMAEDITAEADSGGHTDNRPALALIPTMLALRDELQGKFGYAASPRIGAAGGIATPSSTAGAFALGAAYVMTGSVNQACVEAGTSTVVREMLAQAGQADVVMAPAADMFEMGVKVQVLKWGTMFAVRARKLYDLYCRCGSLDELPALQRQILERDYFKMPLAQAWGETRRFFEQHDPSQIERAESDPKHKVALVFRAYLGQSSKWAIAGDPSRKADYQIWCGPAMGAFNEWTAGSFLAEVQHRDVVGVATNLMVGAAVLTRVGWLRVQGVQLPAAAGRFAPRPLADLRAMLE